MNRNDENWAIARSIQLTPSREGLEPGCHGTVSAEPHPTGWFISARFDPDLEQAQVDDFAHFVMVRTYLLLEHGPDVAVWQYGTDGVWRATCVGSEGSVDELLPLIA